ncbi:GNAT family N-acetyltransferase [Streptomyces sp. RB6PN25]|uniref:GNAT family N-acetyltransferase n=1 Tax=Streptomyces humicola TaxID=2953240 RepID=A0ABT1Q0A7_9ACTN|nr:GNAT family N-acetyltransferase [Streptomyces humicola]MCQ4082735.1 GNAT family N-acetyltransferase [Streptomyces humicola]
MTTTLRPVGPERLGDDGARSRRFAVCVNGRPVGAVELATDTRLGAYEGRIVSLAVDEPDRRRGRGTVAALAAEEVLRGWGCRRIEAAVPESAGAALRLATALGYTERNRTMLKQLDATPPELPDGCSVRPMGEDEYARWHVDERDRFIRSLAEHGVPYERAVAKADATYHRTLPDGVHTADTALRLLAHHGTDVGRLWLRLRDPADAQVPARVYDVEVDEQHRGRGHGRTLMLAAERECLAAGVRSLGLNVSAGNAPALRLYTSLGYRTTTRFMAKELF